MDYLVMQRKRRIKTTLISIVGVIGIVAVSFSYAKSVSLFCDYQVYDNTIKLKQWCNKTKLIVPKSLYFNKVKDCFIKNAEKLQKISIPYPLTNLNVEECPELKEIDINSQVYNIGAVNCKNIENITTPDLVKTRTEDKNIEEEVDSLLYTSSSIIVRHCHNLKELSVGENYQIILVEDCPELLSITLSGDIFSLCQKGQAQNSI